MSTDTPKPWADVPLTGRLVLADGTVISRAGARRHRLGRGRGVLQHGDHRLSGDPDRSLLRRADHHLHLSRISATSAPTARTPRRRTWRCARACAAACCALTSREPSNYRAAEHLDQWLKARGIIALTGIDTRALTARIREKGMPNGVIAHEPSAKFDIDKLKAEAKAWPGPRRHGPGAGGDVGPELHLGRDALGLGQGLRPAGEPGAARGRRRLRAQAQHPALPGDAPAARSRWCRPRRAPRRSSSASPTACSSPTVRAIRRPRASTPCPRSRSWSPRACRCSASASATRCWASRSAPRPARCTRAITARTIR